MVVKLTSKYCDTREAASALMRELDASGIVSIELEIGCSHADLLLKLARHYPDSYFLGVEVNKEKAVKAFSKVQSRNIFNVAIIHLEGCEFLRACVARSIFSRVHVYFPTPFPESIGLLLPLLRDDFVSELERVMLLGGEFRLATDHLLYFNRAVRCFNGKRWLAQPWSAPQIKLGDTLVIGSGCEIKYRLGERLEIHIASLRLILKG